MASIDNLPFNHAPEEIAASSLLPQFEHHLDAAKINIELEMMLDQGNIPFGGVSKESACTFPCGPALQEVLSYGLLDKDFEINSERQLQTEGKAVADAAAAIIIGRMTDRIAEKKHNTSDNSDCSMQTAFGKIHQLPIPDSPSPFVSEEYLTNAQEVLIVILRTFLNANLKATLDEIKMLDDDNPNRILLTNITKVAYASGYQDAYEFLARGNVTPTNHLYGLLQLMTVRGPIDVPTIRDQNHQITREQAVTLFSKSPILFGLAKNDKVTMNALANEGSPGEQQVQNGVISIGQRPNRLQRSFAPLLYDPSLFHIILFDDPNIIGIGVLSDVNSALSIARKAAFTATVKNPLAEPRFVYTCPGRQPRYKYQRSQREDKKSDAIRYTQKLATELLIRLNERYQKKLTAPHVSS